MLKWMNWIISLLNEGFKKKEKEYQNSLNLQKLTPAKCEKMDYYKTSLDFVFQEPDLLNIAITGSYSAGKSSVIETYKELRKDISFIHISLAQFEDVEDLTEVTECESSTDINTKDIKHKYLEGQILNQLIHQINSKNVPQTRFKIKTPIQSSKIIFNTVLLSLFSTLMLYLVKFDTWATFIEDIVYLEFTTNKEALLVALLINLLIFIYYLYKIIKISMYKPIFKKLSFHNNEIEIFDNKDDSYLNKYLDEIIYLLKNSQVDAIVFEDIDRFNDNSIFNKLREINNLTNKKVINSVKTSKPLRFLYLLRDDIFASKDRTKFFDFMMPVVPYINSSNSYDQLLHFFTKGGIINSFDKTFLERLSLYIDDMRILKNIYNEYIIYNGRIQSTELDSDKLLAMIVYKNIFPKDFSNLQLNSGYIYNVFSSKENLISPRIMEINGEIENILNQKKLIYKEFLNNLDELDALYFTETEKIMVDGKTQDQFQNRVEFIKALKKENSNITYVNTTNYYAHTEPYSEFPSMLNNIHNNAEYIKRKKLIEDKNNSVILELDKRLDEMKDIKNRLKSQKLKDLINNENRDKLFNLEFTNVKINDNEFKEILDSLYFDLIKFLIRNGHIDELTYADYLTYFHENSLSRTDKIFLRSVTDQRSKQFDYKLKDSQTIVDRLDISDFEKEETLNFDLLEYLLEKGHIYSKKLLEQVRDNERFDFVWAYLQQTRKLELIIVSMNKTWVDLWKYLLLNKEKYSIDQLKQYMVYTLYYSDEADMKEMNKNGCMTDFLSEQSDFLSIDNPNAQSIIKGLKILNVRFSYIDFESSNKELFKEVYRYNLYELNYNMIEMLLENIYNIPKNDQSKEKNYTLISSQTDQPLRNYVEDNINAYIGMLLENNQEKFIDDEICTINLLNHKKLDKNYKIHYIENLGTTITNLNEINDESLWNYLLENSVIKFMEDNILAYFYMNGGYDNTLNIFINANSKQIHFNDRLMEMHSVDAPYEFFSATMKNYDLSNERYKMILAGYKKSIDEFDLENIPEVKLKILIELRIVKMTKANIQFIRSKYPSLMICFICENFTDYVSCLDSEMFDKEEIESILSERNISDDDKLTLLEKYPNTISIVDKQYSENVQIYIMKHNFDIDNLEPLIKMYDKTNTSFQGAIEHVCGENIDIILEKDIILSYDLLKSLLADDRIEDNLKKLVLFKHLDRLSLSQIKDCLDNGELYEFASLFEGKRPLIPIAIENENLLNYFKQKGWITKFEVDTKDNKVYRVFGKKGNIRRDEELL